MAQNVYEGMFLLDSNRYSRDPGGISAQIPELIQQQGGEVLASRMWDERRLAYQINGHRKGTYWLTYFRFDGKNLGALTRQCQLNDNIIRTLFLKVEPRLVEPLVAHAQSGTGPAAAAPPASDRRPVRAEVADDADEGEEGDEG